MNLEGRLKRYYTEFELNKLNNESKIKNIPFIFLLYENLAGITRLHFTCNIMLILEQSSSRSIIFLLDNLKNTKQDVIKELMNTDRISLMIDVLNKENITSGPIIDYMTSYTHFYNIRDLDLNIFIWFLNNIIKNNELKQELITYRILSLDEDKELISKGLINPIDVMIILAEKELDYHIMDIIEEYDVNIKELYMYKGEEKYSDLLDILHRVIVEQV